MRQRREQAVGCQGCGAYKDRYGQIRPRTTTWNSSALCDGCEDRETARASTVTDDLDELKGLRRMAHSSSLATNISMKMRAIGCVSDMLSEETS